MNLAPNQINYIKQMLTRDAQERGDSDIAHWVMAIVAELEKEA